MFTHDGHDDPLAGMRGEENDFLGLIGFEGDDFEFVADETQ